MSTHRKRNRTGVRAGVALTAALALGAAGVAAAQTPGPQEADTVADTAPQQDGQWLTGYWHNFDNGSTVMPLADVPEEYNLVAVAFADNHPELDGGITFDVAGDELDGYTDEEFRDDLAGLQDAGTSVIISVGGELGHVDVTDPEQAENFAETTHELMEDYGFDGVDIDLEHGIDAEHMTDALQQLDGLADTDPIITMAPQTIDFQSPDEDYYQLAENISDILTLVNMQYYNSGSMEGCDGSVYEQGTSDFVAALACIQLEMDLEPHQVGLGLPATEDAAGGGYLEPEGVVDALDCLEEGSSCGSFSPESPYGPIGGVMTWSINWDAANGYAFADTVAPRLN
ncbi:chitinase [Nocardiopsis sp. HNM0947]|uniref:chitinase n=1 Tax=Nocardiopsis coralli TaxID=2772213 RepID=A0ABR9P7K2_9ACTN|nr:chitinase [Nocardiopsis coralli]MBE2999808.1 chitinase [Nocardiopsis coralli]